MSDLRAGSGLARSTALHLLLIVLLGFLAYSNTFNSPFQFDDEDYIEGNILVTQPGEILFPFFTSNRLLEGNVKDTVLTRYLGHLSFAINYRMVGFEVMGYHATNLAIHIINALLVYWLVLASFRTPYLSGPSLRENSKLIALFGALLFVAHPVQTQAVTYITQRFTSICAVFYLLSIALYIRARLSARGRGLAFYLLSFMSAIMSMFTKEIAVTLPVAIALYEFVFFESGLKARAKRLLPYLMLMLTVPLLVIVTNSEKFSGRPLIDIIAGAIPAQSGTTRWEYFLTQLRIMPTYLRLMFLPVNQNLGYDYPIYNSFLNVSVLPSFVFLAGIAGLGAVLLRRSARTEPLLRLVSFGIFWFFITLSVESSFIVLDDVIFEHRIYLPSAGVSISVVVGTALAANTLRSRKSRIAAATMLLIIPLCLAAATYKRNTVWQSDVALWEDVVMKAPGSVRGQYNLGIAYADSGRLEEAQKHYSAALSIKPDYVEAHNNLAIVFRRMGLPDQAIVHYQASINLRPDDARPHYNLGNVYREMGLLDDAEVQYRKAIELSSNIDEAYVNLGLIYKKRGMLEEAISYYMNALRLNPDNAPARRNLGNAYLEQGKPDMAISEYLGALRLRPEDYDAHYTLALAYRKMSLEEKAQEHFRIAEELKRKAESADK